MSVFYVVNGLGQVMTQTFDEESANMIVSELNKTFPKYPFRVMNKDQYHESQESKK